MTNISTGIADTPNRARQIWNKLGKSARMFWVSLGTAGTLASAYGMVKGVVAPTTTVASLDQRAQSRLVRMVAEGEMTPSQATNLAQVMVGEAFDADISVDTAFLSSSKSGANYKTAIQNIATSPDATRRKALAAMADPKTRRAALQSLLDIAKTPQALRDVASLADPWDPLMAYQAYDELYKKGEASPATFLRMAQLAIRLDRYDRATDIVELGVTSHTTNGQFARYQLVRGDIANARNNIGEAEGHYKSSLDFLDKSDVAKNEWALRVENMIKLARISQKKLDLEAASDWMVQAMPLLGDVVAGVGTDDMARARIAALAAEVAMIASETNYLRKEYESAADFARTFVSFAGDAVRSDPSALRYQLLLADSWVNLSKHQRRIGQHGLAEESLEQAHTLYSGKLSTRNELP